MVERRSRDLAMFNLAIGSKLRGCDLNALKVEDVPREVRLRARRLQLDVP